MARNDALASGHNVINAVIFSVKVYLCNKETYCPSLFLELHAASNSSSAKPFEDCGCAHAHHAKICT